VDHTLQKNSPKNKLSFVRLSLLLLSGAVGIGIFLSSDRSESTESHVENLEIQSIQATRNLDERIQWYSKLIERVGPTEAQEQLLYSGLPFDGETHLLNHTVGDFLYEAYGVGGLVYCKDYFLASCYHGFILHAIGVAGMAEVDKTIRKCEEGGITVMTQCAHATGHGFLAWIGYANLPAALEECDMVVQRIPEFLVYNCHDGVFMENIWGTHDGEPSPDRWVNPEDILYPCNDPRIAEQYVNACWSNQAQLMFQLFEGDVQKVGAECVKLQNSTYQKTCFNSLARQIHPVIQGDRDTAFELCGLMPNDWIHYCISTVAVSEFSVGGRDLPFEICAGIDSSGKESCYPTLFGIMQVYTNTPEEYTQLCEKIQEDLWKDKCLNR